MNHEYLWSLGILHLRKTTLELIRQRCADDLDYCIKTDQCLDVNRNSIRQ